MKDSPSRNVEIKARVQNIDEILIKAKHLSGSESLDHHQKDTFFNLNNSNGRLKLREEDGIGTLISYDRPDTEGPKLSKFKKCQVSDVAGLLSVLEDALGIKGVVKKHRLLFLVGQTRIHIDKVEGLGNFMELEVMLRDDQTPEEGQVIAEQLMTQLGVSKADLLAGAYMDMLISSTDNHEKLE